MATAKKNDITIFKNRVFLFAKLDVPQGKYQAKNGEKEYSINFTLNKAEAKAWKAKYKKSPDLVEPAEWEEKFKCPWPEDLAEDDEIYVVKTQARFNPNQKENEDFRPRVLLIVNDDEAEDITNLKISNGSRGDISISTYQTTGEFAGTYHNPKTILMTKEGFIEYTANNAAGSEFGVKVKKANKPAQQIEEQEEEEPVDELATRKVIKKAKPTPNPPVDDDDVDSDVPY